MTRKTIYLESTSLELSNGTSHYAESALRQKLQKKRVISKGYLHAHIFRSANAKNLGKRFFDLLINQTLIFDILMRLK